MLKVVFLFFTLIILGVADWEICSNHGPSPRYVNHLANSNKGVYLFGGKHSNSDGYNDLWLWNGELWKFVNKGATPRWDHAYVIMDSLEQLLLFGGRCISPNDSTRNRLELDDTWIYRDHVWNQLEVKGPSSRSSHALAHNSAENYALLFGGRNGKEVLSDTWLFDGSEWHQVDRSGPSGRYGHSLAYNQQTESIFLFGGFDGDSMLNDLWEYKEGHWQEINTKSSPVARMAHAMSFNNDGTGILIGGYTSENRTSGEIWQFQGGQWQLLEYNVVPQARLGHAFTFHTSKNEFILFGGSEGFGQGFHQETWKLKIPD